MGGGGGRQSTRKGKLDRDQDLGKQERAQAQTKKDQHMGSP